MNAFHHIPAASVLLMLCGCLSVPNPKHLSGSDNHQKAATERETALLLLNKMTDDEQAAPAIKALEMALEHDGEDLEVLTTLSNLYIFKGAAHETSVRKKKAAYIKALHYGEAAMMTSPEFRQKISSGATVWDAAGVLETKHLPAMSFWSTALFYQFDECLNKTLKPFSLQWIRRAERVLARAYELDPDWGYGQLHFTYAIYYLMPAVAGGDMEKSEAHFKKAVAAGPDFLLNRWGRARYFYGKTKDTEAAIADLKWVLEQDAAKAPGPIYWNLYCQRDARALLKKMQ